MRPWSLILAIAAVAFGGLPEFVSRPSVFQKEFPSRASFKRSGGRRLKASEGRPARTRYDFVEAGFRFVYEVSAESDAGQIVNADHDARVAAISCDADDGMAIRWVGPGHVELSPGDVVNGGAEWRCGTSGGFVRQVVSVELAPGLLSIVETSPASALGVFRDVYVDLTWQRAVGERHRRAQQDEEGEPGNSSVAAEDNSTAQALEEALAQAIAEDEGDAWGPDISIPPIPFNWNESRGEAEAPIDIGSLRCSECWARLEPTASLRIETTGVFPTLVSFRMDLDFEAYFEIEQGPSLAELIEVWVPILTLGGLNLLDAAASFLGVPLFHNLNEAYLNLLLQPYVSLHVLLISIQNIVIDGTAYANVSGTSNNTWFEVRWDWDSGFNVLGSADFDRSFHYSGTSLGARITTGLRPCVGLRVMVDDPPQLITSVEACPEILVYFESVWDVTDYLPRFELGAEKHTKDMELCFEFVSFDTQLDLDPFSPDEPFARGCFLGYCVETSKDRRFGWSTDNGACNCSSPCGMITGGCPVESGCEANEGDCSRARLDGGEESEEEGRGGRGRGGEPGHACHSACSTSKVHWWDGPQCMMVEQRHLGSVHVTLNVFESDPRGDEAYAESARVVPFISCPSLAAGRGVECALEVGLVPAGNGGGEARLSVVLSARALPAPVPERRVALGGEDKEYEYCSGVAWGVQLGLSGRFTGVRLPVYFRLGGLRSGSLVVDPVESPNVQPLTLLTGCEEDPNATRKATIPTTTTSSSTLFSADEAFLWSASESLTSPPPELNPVAFLNWAWRPSSLVSFYTVGLWAVLLLL